MSVDETIRLTRDDLSRPEVDQALAHQKAILRQSRPIETPTVSPVRILMLSSLFYTPLAGLLGGFTSWLIIEPMFDDQQESIVNYLAFPALATLVAIFIFIADGIASRRVRGNIDRWLYGTGLTLLFSFLACLPAGMIFSIFAFAFFSSTDPSLLLDITLWPASAFLWLTVTRSVVWAILGTSIGVGMNLVRGTSKQLRNSMMGGAAGGALGGLFFDSIDRFVLRGAEQVDLSRAIGFCAVGLCVGIFVALGERLGREAWVRVKTGPLAGKSFILYRNPTVMGSSPQADIYLFKDPGISPTHSAIHCAGASYEIEDLGSLQGTFVEGRSVRRQRLVSGDQVAVGDTVLEFEERAKRRSLGEAVIKER